MRMNIDRADTLPADRNFPARRLSEAVKSVPECYQSGTGRADSP
jgi:hypothetical protein